MISRLIFPDPLVWQSGLEWGIEAFAMLVDEGHDLRCYLRADGPMFEAIAFAALDLGVLNRSTFNDSLPTPDNNGDVWVLCRVNTLVQPELTIPTEVALVLTETSAKTFQKVPNRHAVPDRSPSAIRGAIDQLTEAG